jgi:hypothetical protein
LKIFETLRERLKQTSTASGYDELIPVSRGLDPRTFVIRRLARCEGPCRRMALRIFRIPRSPDRCELRSIGRQSRHENT